MFTWRASTEHPIARSPNVQVVSPSDEWIHVGVLAGFLATFAMTLVLAAAYGLAQALGNPNGRLIARWLWALAHSRVAARTADGVFLAIGANLAVGLLLALVYARFVAPRLAGPGWWNGMRFALIPWILSLLVFLPLTGGGLFGLAIGAGPLPMLGNLVLHLVYGAVLGSVVAVAADDWLDDTEAERAHALAAERGAAIGVMSGLMLGAAVGWTAGPTVDGVDGRAVSAIAAALIFGAVGLAIGSFAGMERLVLRRKPGDIR
jgi:hypothetical protein